VLAAALEVGGDRAPQAPVGGTQGGDAGGVDGVVVALLHGVAVEQQDGVADVLLVELDDLELGEQQLRQRYRRGVELEALGERDLVAHAEGADEDVDLPAVVVVEEQRALARVHRVERDVRVVARVAQQLVEPARITLGDGEVEVLVLAIERRRHLRGPQADGHPAQEAQVDSGLRGEPEKALALGDDVLEDRGHRPPRPARTRLLRCGASELLRMFSSPPAAP
jgi:hypothetical protein